MDSKLVGLLLPEDKFINLKIPGKTLPRCERKNHYKMWTEACKKDLKQHVRQSLVAK